MKKKEKLKTSAKSKAIKQSMDGLVVEFFKLEPFYSSYGTNRQIGGFPTSKPCMECTMINGKEFDDKDVTYTNDPNLKDSVNISPPVSV